jgi:hypothetical protein
MNTLAILDILANYLPGLEITLYPRLVEIDYGTKTIMAMGLQTAVEALVERILKDPESAVALVEALKEQKK